MPDLFIRDVPKQHLHALDAQAGRLGISRAEFVRRLLSGQARRSDQRLTRKNLTRFGELTADLRDPEIMRRSWS